MTNININRIYRVNISYDFGPDCSEIDVIDIVSSKFLDLEITENNPNIEITENFIGNACCGPYVIIEGQNKDELETFTLKCIDIIKSFNNYRIEV